MSAIDEQRHSLEAAVKRYARGKKKNETEYWQKWSPKFEEEELETLQELQACLSKLGTVMLKLFCN